MAILKESKKMLLIKQIGSPIRRNSNQLLYLKSLGLGKINRTKEVLDSLPTRGLLLKLRHMVIIVEQ